MRSGTATVMVAALASACVLVFAAAAPATTYLVRPNGSGDFATIQAAIDGVVNGDIIELASGTFDGAGNRDIDFGGKAVTVRSQSGNPTDVTIDCEGTQYDPHRGFWFHSGEGASSVLQNITVVNGFVVDGNGGAVLCEGAAPTIEGCIFGSNTVDGGGASGGAIYMLEPPYFVMTGCRFIGNAAGEFTHGYGGAVAVVGAEQGEFHDCVFGPGNYAGGSGGGVYMELIDIGDLYFENCDITDNGAPLGGGICSQNGTLAMMDCSVYWNDSSTEIATGGGLACFDSGNIVNCTFMGNFGVLGGNCYFGAEASVDFVKCIVTYSLMGGGIYVPAPGRAVNVQCCCVSENTGGNYVGDITDQTGIDNNFSADPLFCDAPSGDLSIYDTSECAAANSPCGELVGAEEVGCETAVEPTTWGKLKAKFD